MISIKKVRTTLLLMMTTCLLALSFSSKESIADSAEEFNPYQEVMSGRMAIEDLSFEQRRQLITIQEGIVTRSSCDGCSEECRASRQGAEGYRVDLEIDISQLSRCIGRSDLTDDCFTEFSRVQSSHSEFEAAVANSVSYCRESYN